MAVHPRFLGFLLLFLTIPAFGDTEAIARAHSEAFDRAMNASDVNAALALYAEDAHVVCPGQGEEAHGKIAIRALIDSTLRNFPKDSRLALQSQEAVALADGYIATVSHWEQSYAREDGTIATFLFRATEVIRATGRELRKYSFVECDKYQRSLSVHTVTPGDVPGHEYSLRVWRHNYATTDPEYGEADTIIFQVTDDVFGVGTNFGTAVDTLANGGSVFWQFRGTHKTDQNGGASSFEGVGTIVGGTGKYVNARGREVYRGKATGTGCKTEGEAQWDD